MIRRCDIEAARARIAGLVRLTPVLEVEAGLAPVPLALKLEHMQVTGSFKVRGSHAQTLVMLDQAAV